MNKSSKTRKTKIIQQDSVYHISSTKTETAIVHVIFDKSMPWQTTRKRMYIDWLKIIQNTLTTACQNVNWIYMEKTEKNAKNSGTLTLHLKYKSLRTCQAEYSHKSRLHLAGRQDKTNRQQMNNNMKLFFSRPNHAHKMFSFPTPTLSWTCVSQLVKNKTNERSVDK